MKAQMDIRFNAKQRNPYNVVRDYEDMVMAMFVDPLVKYLLKSETVIASLKIAPASLASRTAIKEHHFKYFKRWAEKNRKENAGRDDAESSEDEEDDEEE
eukprot:75984-Ditylum_brightwellii.AAC.1